MTDYEFVEIKESDLCLHDEDCIYTRLCLDDYGWSTYEYTMHFRLENGGRLEAKEIYTLFAESDFVLKYISGYSVKKISFKASSDLVVKHIKEQALEHLRAFDESEGSPLVDEIVIRQYNEIIQCMKGKDITTSYYELERKED